MSKSDGIDLVGLGKLAKAIPDEVYTTTTKAALTTFEKLIAPITESTAGLGRYVRQKFDNMVEIEKALAAYALQEAVRKAQLRVANSQSSLIPPVHPKSLIKSLEEASKETNPILNAMWCNLMAAQITDTTFHPHFVEILPHFSPAEAQILVSLLPRSEIGPNGGGYFWAADDAFKRYITSASDNNPKPWSYSCALLCEFEFADVAGNKSENYGNDVTILFRTISGTRFLKCVSSDD